MPNTVLELSTAHITFNDNDVLGDMGHNPVNEPLNIGNMQYGYAIVLPVEREYFNRLREECEEEHYKLSESFWKLMQYAFDNKHRVVIIDRDAEVIDGLDEHDW